MRFLHPFAFLLSLFLCLALGACTHVHRNNAAPDASRGDRGGSAAEEAAADPEAGSFASSLDPAAFSFLSNGTLPGPVQFPEIDAELATPLEDAVTKLPSDVQSEPVQKIDKEHSHATAPASGEQEEPSVAFDLEIRETRIMQDYFDYYAQKKHATFQRWLHRAERYLPYIRKVFRDHGLPEDLIFLPFAESGFNPWAYSRAGAAGLWQFMPGTGRLYGLEVDWWIDERRDPYKATVAAAKHLKKLYQEFKDWNLVLAAYNAGQGRVSRAMRRSGHQDFYKLASSRAYLHRETRYYVPKFMAILKIVRNLKANGFEPLSWDAPDAPPVLKVEGGTDLMALSRQIGMDWKSFQRRNPAFRRRASPPGRSCSIYLPQEALASAKDFLQSENSRPYAGFRRYRVRSGDSWWRISRRFNTPIRVLKQVNDTSSNFLRKGQYVLIPGSSVASLSSSRSKDGKQTVYTVRQGDSLWKIARAFGLDVQTLRRANNLGPRASRIRPGQKLRIPGSEKSSKRMIAKRRANYTVRKGDTLWDLSRRFGVSVQTLLVANGLGNPKSLHQGDKLYIPDLTAEETKRSQRQAKEAHQRIVYKVQRGDNIWSIARKFGVSTRKVLSWNDLHGGELIHPGDELEIRLQ